jgi:misacylated tRNA(Ala) deacylase
MTEELFREDANLLQCTARVLACAEGGLILDRTVFYPQGGGQAGDAGVLRLKGGPVLVVTDTRKAAADGPQAGHIVHLIEPEQLAWLQGQAAGLEVGGGVGVGVGAEVEAEVDTVRRQAHRRFHTATHLLCALVPHPVDGCSITATYARLDFHMTEPLDKEALTSGLAGLVHRALPVRHRWITEAELDANPQLVRSMSVQPPRGQGRVRVLEIEGVDVQPCGGTHVDNTADIGTVVVTKIEKKSAKTRRVVLGFAEPAARPG